jgi:hypothetical protein
MNKASSQYPQLIWGLPLFVVYILVTWVTAPLNIGDTPVYVDAILRVVNGGSAKFWDQGGFLSFWEFGHLLWRPLGWLAFKLLNPFFDADLRAGVTRSLVILNWLFGLVAIFSLQGLVNHISTKPFAAFIATTGLIFSNAFLNYVQSGCSYVPGLALLLFGFYLQVKAVTPVWKAIVAGISLAGAVGMWFPYSCAVPAALVSPLLLFGFSRTQLRTVIIATSACALAGILMYGAAIAALGLGSVSEIRQWARSSSHEVTENRGAARVVFGIPRSLINMGADSVFFKRFLKNDPYNPIGFFDLARRSLWKIAFAYLFLFALLAGMFGARSGRRLFWLFLVGAVPIIGFAWLFAGGVLERYFPLFPLFFLAAAFCLSANEVKSWWRYIALSFILVTCVVNGVALSHRVVDQEREAMVGRVRDLFPLVNENTRVFVPPQDQLWGGAGRLQFERQTNFHVDPVAILGTAQVSQWKSDFAQATLSVWEQQNDVWIAKRFLSPSPRPEWNWTEGEDPRITWADLHKFFSKLETNTQVGSDDGFVRLTPSEKNKQRLGSSQYHLR